MKRLATAILLGIIATHQAAGDDLRAEVMEWVIEPCMEVAVVLDVKTIRKDQLESGIKRTHIAKVMAASRDAVARDLAAKMNATATWKDKRARPTR